MSRPIVVGVAGGSGSGKTTVVRELMRGVNPGRVALLHHDSYYRDFDQLAPPDRARVNFEHPDALETALMVHHVRSILAGRG